jgi:hypothetical protein
MNGQRPAAGFLIGALMLLVLWQVAALLVNRPILPSPLTVVPLFVRDIGGELGLHFLASTARVLAAIGLATMFATPLGLILGQSKMLDRVCGPLIAIIYPIPKIIFLPVIYVLIGISDFSKILLIAIIIFFQILVVVRDEAAGSASRAYLISQIFGGGAAGAVSLRLSACLPAGGAYRAAGVGGHRHRGAVYRRAIADQLRAGVLYRHRDLPGAALPADVYRHHGHGAARAGALSGYPGH